MKEKDTKNDLTRKLMSIPSEQHPKRCRIGKHHAMKAYIDSGQKIHFHPRQKRHLQETDILEWMTKGKTTLIQKHPQKESLPTTNSAD